MAWVKVLPLEEVPVGEARAAQIGLDDLLVCRPAAETVHVLEDVCSHDEAALGSQTLDGVAVTCPRHGARFDITTGAVLRSPAPVGIATFPARIHAGWIEADLEA
jgi:3-phenylpropionate/trans-cinnamate dioxygenase ferredoxin component